MKYVLAAAFALSTVGAAYAGDMQDKENLDHGQSLTDDAVKQVALPDNCGGPITAKLDRASFKGDAATAVANFCANAVDGVAGVCQSMPTHKKDVLKGVKTMTCHYDPKLTDYAVKVVKKGTSVDVYFNKDSANIQTQVGDYLQKNL